MDAQWLKTQFELHPEKTKADLARALSLDAPAISKILSGNRQIKAGEYITMRKFFGYPVESYKGSSGMAASNMYELKPLGGLKDSRSEKGEENDNRWLMPAGLLKRKTDTPPEQIKIFSVDDNSMSPDFLRGEQVLVDISDHKASPPGVFIISDGVGYVLRRCEVVPRSAPLQIRVSALSKTYDSYEAAADDIDIIGRAIAKLEWL